jgi:3-oxoacyl-[acyl-carrier protein] reductase
VGKSGITANILAPGYHLTPAVNRVLKKKSEVSGISFEEATKQVIQSIPAGSLGDPADFSSLAVWLLSPLSRYITGQTISVEGGAIKGIFG